MRLLRCAASIGAASVLVWQDSRLEPQTHRMKLIKKVCSWLQGPQHFALNVQFGVGPYP